MRVCRRQQQDYKNQQRPFALFLSSQLTGVAPSISTSSTLFPFFSLFPLSVVHPGQAGQSDDSQLAYSMSSIRGSHLATLAVPLHMPCHGLHGLTERETVPAGVVCVPAGLFPVAGCL